MVTKPRINILDVQREICRRSLLDFLGHVQIPDPPPEGRGVVAFDQTWPSVQKLHHRVEAVRPGGALPVLKSRRLGVTSYFEARFIHSAMYRKGAVHPVESQGDKEAKEVIEVCKFIWEHLPDHLRSDLVVDNTEELKFKDGGSIISFPATAKAGRSFGGTEILMDEADMHERFGVAYTTLLPLIQDTGGKLFAVSTPDPERVDSDFRQMYRNTPDDNKLYLGYYDRPGRTEETYQAGRELAGRLGIERGGEARYEKENSRTEEEALAPPTALMYFNREALMDLSLDCLEPKETSKGGLIRIWQRPIVGRKYIAHGDVAWGEKGAYSCVTIADWQTLEQVAEIYGRPELDELAQVTVDLCTAYNKAFTGIEANGEGIKVVNKMIELGYGDRMYHRGPDWSRKFQERGWFTTGGPGGNRRIMLGDLEEVIRKRQIRVRCREAINEFMSFIRDDTGKLNAAEGAYADHVFSWAGLVQIREFARYHVDSGKPVRVGRRF
ncbi:MAG: hypothetical protein J3T61_03260 [Candidatus Brocadiales bacterium]|nr:hypothetical protein [Candidatus Bathyanammoxibius sp.]